MTINPATLNDIILVLTAFGAAFFLVLWVSLIIWTYRDIRSRTRAPLTRFLACLVVALLFLPGLLIYWIVRPNHTLEEEYQSTLEEEALLQSIEDPDVCPGCRRRVRDEWLYCPTCQAELKRTCGTCGKLLDLRWKACPFCGTAVANDLDEAPVQGVENPAG